MEVKELLRKRAKLVTDARVIDELAAKEERAKTPEERTQFDGLLTQAESVGDEIAQRQRFDALAGVVDHAGNRTGGDPMPHHETKHTYSILRAINCFIHHKPLDGLEAEVSTELEVRRNRKVRGNGFVMPLDLAIDARSAALGRAALASVEHRVLNTTTGTGGVVTQYDTTYIDLLRTKMMTRQAGARVLTDMVGNFTIPRQSAAATGYWVAESGPVTASNQTIDQVAFTPKTVGAMTDISRRFAELTNIDAEMFVRDDLTAVVARALDLAGLAGTGLSNQPTGIMANSSVTIVPIGAAGGPATWAQLVALETAVAVANADMGALAYMTNAKVRGSAKVILKTGTTFPVYLWGEGNTPLNGYPAYVTNQLPSNLVKGASGAVCSPIIFGNWNDLVYALWSGQDVIIDPYTGSSSGTVRIVTLQDADVNVRHPESFAMTLDLTTT